MIGNRARLLFGRRLIFVILIKFAIALGDAEINRASTDCGGEFSGYQYTISSPNYPEDYPNGRNCIYTLTGSPLARCNQDFSLQFLDFSLKPSENCAEDYVQIGDRSVFCGKVVGIRTYPSKDNRLLLRFHSSSKSFSDKGFKILVTALPCTPGQIKEKINGESTDVNEKSSTKNLEATRLNDFSSNDEKLLTTEVTSPPGVESLDGSDFSGIQEDSSDELLSNKFKVPVRGSESFRDSLPLRSEVDNPAKISAYLFVPPISEDSTNFAVTPPSPEILLPSRTRTTFRPSESLGLSKNLPLVKTEQRSNGRLIVPAATYGVPEGPYYPSFQGPSYNVATGEILDNPDCQKGPNVEPNFEVTANFRNKIPVSFPEGKCVSGNISPVYGSLVLRYPAIENVHTVYGQPGNIASDFPANHRPNDWSVPNFVPNLPPNVGVGFPGSFPESVGRSQCCRNPYVGQRYFITSPGFPSLFYSGNPYECVYQLIPFSQNTCRMRFNFKFFNFGTEDPICSNGYVEIDGRRYCGCKKGLSVVSIVTSPLSKVIGVAYVGYPRTKFSGFLIEVVHEACQNGYPYNARSKKDVGNATEGFRTSKSLENDTSLEPRRTKRSLGYDYSKPSFGLNEEPTWNPGSSGNALWNHGENIFSPLLSCQAFSFFDWTIAAKESYLTGSRCLRNGNYPVVPTDNWNPVGGGFPGNSGFPVYPGNGVGIFPQGSSSGWNPFPSSSLCKDINIAEGVISSPQYPTNYPNYFRKCYRFHKAPDSCLLEIAMLDFDVENSVGCSKDYVTFTGLNRRFCGRSLLGIKLLIDISRSNFVDMLFLTDGFGTGRGFNVGFSQIPCRVSINRQSH